MRSVRISSTSRKPLVVMRPTLAPLCSRMALEATVVPWRISSDDGGGNPVSCRTCPKPSTMARRIVVDAGGDLLRVDGAVRSEQHDVGERAADVDADAVGGLAGHARLLCRAPQSSGSCHWHLGHLAPAAALGDLRASRARSRPHRRVQRLASTIDAVVGHAPWRATANSLRTSFSTAAGSRSSGSPQPPPPAMDVAEHVAALDLSWSACERQCRFSLSGFR